MYSYSRARIIMPKRGEKMTNLLYAVYIGTGIFGLGITVIDLLGLIGDNDSEGADSASEFDGDADIDAEADIDIEGGDDSGSIAGHDIVPKGNSLLRILSAIRSLIYFCLGFGPTGFAALLMKKTAGESLLWGGAIGLIALFGARAIRRIMKKDLNSEIRSEDALMETGIVTVGIGENEIGKVRLTIGGSYVERFAKCADKDRAIAKDTKVRVIDADEEYIYVEII